MNYYSLLRVLLFSLPPEISHYVALRGLTALSYAHLWRKPDTPKKRIKLMGLNFSNRLGVAAGLDKNGDYVTGLARLGFGFIELGTVTPFPQAGNSKPRLFRLPKSQALINRMGFNNRGVDYLIAQLGKHPRPDCRIGINIGKNAATLPTDANNDYVVGLRKAYPWADYITINISSPNTRNLRDLQYGSALSELLQKLKQEQQSLSEETGHYKPLLVKVAPDLTDTELKWFAEQIRYWQIDGVIATNTTIDHSAVLGQHHAKEEGGLSGRPLATKSLHALKILREELGDGFPIVSVGGIMSADDAKERIKRGADLVQIYTGLIYQGPPLVKSILNELS